LEPVWQLEVERLVPDEGHIPRRPDDRADRSHVDPGRGSATNTSRALVDAWQRHRFFEGLARAVLSTSRPTLLVLDDLQWCDQETAALLAFVLRFADGARLLLAATVRSDELEDNREVAASLRAMRSAGFVTD